MRIFRYILFVLLVFVVGCSTSKTTSELIERSMNVAQECPDSAMLYIERVDASTIRGKRDMARYRLAYSEALYYNQIDSDCDSLTRPLFDYYYYSDSHAERARAMYQHGWVMNNASNRAEAMYALMEAEKSLQHCDNPRLLGLVHRTKGDIYRQECLYNNAVRDYELAKVCFADAQLPIHELHLLYKIGQTYGLMREYDDAIQALLIAESDAVRLNQPLMHFDILIELCYLYIQLGDYNNCEDVYKQIDVNENAGYSLCDYYSIGVAVEAHRKNFCSADELLIKAKSEEYVISPIRLEYVEMRLNISKEDYKTALDIYKNSIKQQDEWVLSALKHNILNYEMDIVKKNIDDIREANTRLKSRFIYMVIFVLFVLTIIAIFVRSQRLKHQREVLSYINTINELELLSSRESNTDVIVKEIESLYQPNICELNRLCEIYYENIDSNKCAKKIAVEVSQSISNLKEDAVKLNKLERIVNIYKGDIMVKLREQCHTLTDREMKIALYTFAGFSNRAISMLVECRAETLPKIKYKIRCKIAECCNEKDAEVMTQLLSRRSS